MAEELENTELQEDPTLPNNEQAGDTGDAEDGTGTPPSTGSEDKVTALTTELEELKKRVSGQTRSWQEERAARERAETELAKYNKYKEVIDFSELDGLVQENQTPEGQRQKAQPAIDPHIQNRIGSLETMVLEQNYVNHHPDKAFVFKDSDLKAHMESNAVKAIQAEMQEYGRVISKPEDLIDKAVNNTVNFVNKMRAEGVKTVTEKRKKIETSGADLGGITKPDSGSSDEEDKPLSQQDYVSLQQQAFNRAKNLAE